VPSKTGGSWKSWGGRVLLEIQVGRPYFLSGVSVGKDRYTWKGWGLGERNKHLDGGKKLVMERVRIKKRRNWGKQEK